MSHVLQAPSSHRQCLVYYALHVELAEAGLTLKALTNGQAPGDAVQFSLLIAIPVLDQTLSDL